MKLTRMTLEKFGRFDRFSFDFRPGVTMLLGNNGVGKSTLLTALEYALTGQIGPYNKADYINWEADPKKGSVCLEFEAANVKYMLTRNLHAAKDCLAWEEGGATKQLRKVNEIEERMLVCRGLPPEPLRESSFVQQGHFVDVVDMRHAARLDYFQRVTGVSKAELIRTVLQEEGINSIPTYPDRAAELRELDQELDRLSAEGVRLASEAAQAQAMIAQLEGDPQYTKAQRTLAARSFEEVAAAVHQVELELQSVQQSIDKLEKQRPPEVASADPVSEEDQHLSRTYAMYLKDVARLQKAQQDVEKVEATPELVPPVTNTDELGKQLLELRENKRDLQQKHTLVSTGVCPTCAQPIRNIDMSKEELEAALQDVDRAISEKSELSAAGTRAVAAYQADRQARAYQVQTVRGQLEQATTAMAAYDVAQFKAFDKEATDAKWQAWTVWSNYLGVVRELEQKVNALTSQKATATARIDALRAEPCADATARQAAQDYLARVDAERRRQHDLSTAVVENKTWQSAKRAEADRIRKEQVQQSTGQDMLGVLQETRTVFHRDNLPSAVMRRYSGRLNKHMAQYLEDLQAPFTAWLTPDFEFMHLTSRTPAATPATFLSMGQKVLLALAFRLAVVNVVNTQLPLLCLDEPSAHLDTGAVDALIDVLRSVEGQLKQRACVLVIDHHPSMRAVFHDATYLGA